VSALAEALLCSVRRSAEMEATMISDWLFGGSDEPRDERCRKLVERCGYAAAALTILPIPGSEVIGVMPIHVGMVIGIGQ
jgi:hypothetical protein